MSLLLFGDASLQFRAPRPDLIRPVKSDEPPFRFPSGPEIKLFSADTEELVVAALPPAVLVPASVLGSISAAKRLDVWLETAAAVQAWAIAEGERDAVWVDDNDRLALPAALADRAPAWVREWVRAGDDAAAIINALAS